MNASDLLLLLTALLAVLTFGAWAETQITRHGPYADDTRYMAHPERRRGE